MCPRCGWPVADCRCSATPGGRDEPVPDRPVAKLRVEKKGRGGKSVTVIDGLPRNRAFVEGLARELKQALGTGGTALDGGVEIQGDRRDRLRELLGAKGFRVKG
jgi:translation initiation factor 1